MKGEDEKAKLAECAHAGVCMRAREVGGKNTFTLAAETSLDFVRCSAFSYEIPQFLRECSRECPLFLIFLA